MSPLVKEEPVYKSDISVEEEPVYKSDISSPKNLRGIVDSIIDSRPNFKFNSLPWETYTPLPIPETQEEIQEEEPEVPIPVTKQNYVEQHKLYKPTGNAQKRKALSNVMDLVSTESGMEVLKSPEVKKILLNTADRESGYNQSVKNSTSTARGLFQFINSTRQAYSKVPLEKFLKDLKEQIRTAVKYYNKIQGLPYAKPLRDLGLSNEIITNLGWWQLVALKNSYNMIMKFRQFRRDINDAKQRGDLDLAKNLELQEKEFERNYYAKNIGGSSFKRIFERYGYNKYGE